MLTKNDCLVLLKDISDKGIDTDKYLKELLSLNIITSELISFIYSNIPLDIKDFYELLRKKYNSKKSKLYKEIVQIDKKEPKDGAITLSSLLTQILLYSKNASDSLMFIKHSRADEITKALYTYTQTGNYGVCIQLITLIKADLKVIEYRANN